MTDFLIKYKLPNEISWKNLVLNRSFFPSSPSDEDVSIEIREYLYIALEKEARFSTFNTEDLDEVIDQTNFLNGSLFDEALVIYDKISREE